MLSRLNEKLSRYNEILSRYNDLKISEHLALMGFRTEQWCVQSIRAQNILGLWFYQAAACNHFVSYVYKHIRHLWGSFCTSAGYASVGSNLVVIPEWWWYLPNCQYAFLFPRNQRYAETVHITEICIIDILSSLNVTSCIANVVRYLLEQNGCRHVFFTLLVSNIKGWQSSLQHDLNLWLKVWNAFISLMA